MTSTEFRQFRSQLGLSQSELGRIMGLTAREISRIEISRNPTRVQAAFIRHIAAERLVGHCRPHYLIWEQRATCLKCAHPLADNDFLFGVNK